MVLRFHHLQRLLVIGAVALLLTACADRSQPTTAVASLKPKLDVSAPVTDKVMGGLSIVARHIVGALQDPAIRGNLVRALKTSSVPGQMDLQDCGPMSMTGKLLDRGEKAGMGNAASMCAFLASRPGVILFMDRDRLAGWDSTVVPVVTAIADPDNGEQLAHLGYRSPSRTILLPADGSYGGPVLVVLPLRYPGRRSPNASELTLRIGHHQ